MALDYFASWFGGKTSNSRPQESNVSGDMGMLLQNNKDRIGGVYRGVWSPLFGVAMVNAAVFGALGNMQPECLQAHFFSGAAAGLVQSVVASPVELVKTRLQTSKAYRSSTDCFKKTYKQEGIRGVYKGLGITTVRDVLGYGLYFATFEALTRTSSGSHVGTGAMVVASGFSGTVSCMLTYPFDVIKSRYQVDVSKYSGVIDCAEQSIRREGIMCLTRGMTPTLIRVLPTNVVTFTVVSWVFRLVEMSMSKSEEINSKITSIIQTVLNVNYELNIVDLVQGTNSFIKIGCLFDSIQPEKKHQKAVENKMVDFRCDVCFDKLHLKDILGSVVVEPSGAELNDTAYFSDKMRSYL